ncbi:hypothetical protein KKD19_05380 [Patescibacteria group bacterium]|nr:hypothetical protein [Patescibacteria group bacterium]MCG2693543.1 hypothetical protein [Candidatus Parcubacteria bacterium]
MDKREPIGLVYDLAGVKIRGGRVVEECDDCSRATDCKYREKGRFMSFCAHKIRRTEEVGGA